MHKTEIQERKKEGGGGWSKEAQKELVNIFFFIFVKDLFKLKQSFIKSQKISKKKFI